MFLILQCFYFMLPAIFANMAPVMFKQVRFLKYPLDFNLQFAGKPVLGKNKTFRGLFFGVLLAVIVSYIQYLLQTNGVWLELPFISYENWFFIGVLFGGGAILGDAVESFFKRRVGIKPGQPFIPFDQLDAVLGVIVVLYPFYPLSWDKIAIMSVIAFVLHVTVNHAAFYLKIRNEKW